MDKRYMRKYSSLAVLLLISLLSFGLGLAEEETPEQDIRIFLPSVVNHLPGNSITGRVTNYDNVPIVGVTISTDEGDTAITNEQGYYALYGLSERIYTLTPYLGGATFSPEQAEVVVPPNVAHLNFTTSVNCADVIVNGGFETSDGWELPVTAYPAAYSSAVAYSGGRAMRTGIVNPVDNRYSYSSARQAVYIPSDASGAVLRFWLYPMSGETAAQSIPDLPAQAPLETQPLSSDVQYALVLDAYNNILETLLWQRSDSRIWTYYEFNLLKYAGRTIKIHIGTYNDGWDGVTAAYIDEVSLQLCPVSVTPTPTGSPPPGGCSNLIQNESFETISAWDIPITRYPAGYATAQYHTGSQSMRTGIVNPVDNRYSYSDFRQIVSIPAGSTDVNLGFWLYSISGELGAQALSIPQATGMPFEATPLASDLQYVLILDQYQNWIDTLVWQRSNARIWTYYQFDLRKYAGRTIYIQFGTYNDGWNGLTAMYVDDVTLNTCYFTPTPSNTPTITPTPTSTPTPTPTPTPTQTPTPTNTPTVTPIPTGTYTPGPCEDIITNGGFENNDGWEIPITRYPAGYSYAQAHSGARSMRAGIVNPADNTYSYSDFRQTVAIPLDADSATLGMWSYPLSGELLSAPLSPPPEIGSVFETEAPANDVQYLLVLDQNYVILDVLIWQLDDSQTWEYREFDLQEYAGWVIKLQWGVYNTGWGGVTAMYVDDVALNICR